MQSYFRPWPRVYSIKTALCVERLASAGELLFLLLSLLLLICTVGRTALLSRVVVHLQCVDSSAVRKEFAFFGIYSSSLLGRVLRLLQHSTAAWRVVTPTHNARYRVKLPYLLNLAQLNSTSVFVPASLQRVPRAPPCSASRSSNQACR